MARDLMVGADAGGSQVKYMIVTLAGEILHQGEVPTDPSDPTDTFTRLASAIRKHIGDPADRLLCIGMACAGIVSVDSGRLGRSPNLPGWEGSALGASVRSAFADLPVVVANDVNAALYGEFCRGAGRGCQDLAMIALGTGVGGGVMVSGKLQVGSSFGAGEIGHMVLDLDGPRCTCGNRGCLEAYAGEVALVQRARERTADPAAINDGLRSLMREEEGNLTTAALYRLACAGDPVAAELFASAGKRLGQAVGNVVNLLDPQRVIIGGGVAQAGELLLAPCREVVGQIVLAENSRQVPVVLAELGPHAAALGAAFLARQEEHS